MRSTREHGERFLARVDGLRPRVAPLDVAMTSRERDRGAAGSVLACALAFRLFVPLLPLAVLLAVTLGYTSTHDPTVPGSVAHDLGIRQAALTSIANSARLSAGDRLGVIAFALIALATAAFSAGRAIRAVHALAWGMAVQRFPRAPAAAVAFIGWDILFLGLWALSAWARSTLGPAGILVTLLLIACFFAMWLAVSMTLPHPAGLPWRAFVPGAVLMAIGVEGIHLVTVLYLEGKANDVSAVYGSLGTALVLLLWLYFVGRLIVASAFLNAAAWGRRPPAPAKVGPADTSGGIDT